MSDLTVLPPPLEHAAAAYNAGRFFEAEQLCQQLVTRGTGSFDTFLLLGATQINLGRKHAALSSYETAIKLRPEVPRAHLRRGQILHQLERYADAVASYDQAIRLRPDFAMAYSDRGISLGALRRYHEALASYDRAVEIRPDFAAAHFNRGNVLQDLNRLEEALAAYDRALQSRPELAEAHCNRGNVLQKLKHYEQAIASYDRAISLRPGFAVAHSNRGAALQALNRYEEAITSYDCAINIRPDYPGALSDRGLALEGLNRHEEALASYSRAFNLQPDHAEAHYAWALCQLLRGDFERGWQQHEWRWQAQQLHDRQRSFTKPLWLGDREIAGKTILLHAEQGFGDTIQFCRYVPLVAERGAQVVLEVQKELTNLMGTLAGPSQVVSEGQALPNFDVHCPLLSLPLALGTRLDTIPSATPYLGVPAPPRINWDGQLPPRTRPRIGLAWSGRPTHRNDHNRSVRLSSLLPLLDVDAAFVSLQTDVRPQDAPILKDRKDILQFGDHLTDFADTAALISNLDLVISVDTSLVHLAGALAKPVWILLPFCPDWRWLLDRDDSPWYPTARLFRQDASRNWDKVIVRVYDALLEFFKAE